MGKSKFIDVSMQNRAYSYIIIYLLSILSIVLFITIINLLFPTAGYFVSSSP